jgi:hypothetical protein
MIILQKIDKNAYFRHRAFMKNGRLLLTKIFHPILRLHTIITFLKKMPSMVCFIIVLVV